MIQITHTQACVLSKLFHEMPYMEVRAASHLMSAMEDLRSHLSDENSS